MTHPIRVLFVCMGNICRSPTAEGVFRHHVAAAGLSDVIEVASAGTHDYHVGEPPDRRSMVAALRRSYDLSAQRARHFHARHFERYDHLLAMDRANLAHMHRMAPAGLRERARLFLEFGNAGVAEVPDPYYGGADGFEHEQGIARSSATRARRAIKKARTAFEPCVP